MRRKFGILLVLFSFVFVSFFSSFSIHYNPVQASEKPNNITAITSDMYGESMEKELTFRIKVCKEYTENIKSQLKELEKEPDKGDGVVEKILKGLSNLLFFILFDIFDIFFDSIFNLFFKVGCDLGIAPNQLMQLVFFPITLDQYNTLDNVISFAVTIAILVLCVTSVMSLMEMKKSELDGGEDLIQKIGLFLIAVSLISFSKFFLQGIYDIANALTYFVSAYKIDYPLLNWGTSNEAGFITATIVQFPLLIVQLVEFAFDNEIQGTLAGAMMGPMGAMMQSILKVIIYFFVYKDLFKIALFGVKRIILLFSAAVITPILAALIPSRNTVQTFTGYIKGVIASAFVPALYGLMLVATGPLLIDIINEVQMPTFLDLIFMVLYCNVMASLPEYIESTLGADKNLRGDTRSAIAPVLAAGAAAYAGASKAKGAAEGINNAKHQLNQRYAKAGATKVGKNGKIEERKATFGEALKQYGKNKMGEAKYGQKLYYKARIHQGEEDAATEALKQQEAEKRRERSQMFNQANFAPRPIRTTQDSGINADGSSGSGTSGTNTVVGNGTSGIKDSNTTANQSNTGRKFVTIRKGAKLTAKGKIFDSRQKFETATVPLNINGEEKKITIRRPTNMDNEKDRVIKNINNAFKKYRDVPKRN